MIEDRTYIKEKVVLIDTYNSNPDDYLDDFKDYCKDNGYKLRGKGTEMQGLYLGGKVTFWDWYNSQLGELADDFWRALERRKKSYYDYCIVTGVLGLWNGHYSVYQTYQSLYDALAACSKDALDIAVSVENDVITFNCYHHDGVNHFEIRVLSWDDYDKIQWWDDKDGNVEDYVKGKEIPLYYEIFGL